MKLVAEDLQGREHVQGLDFAQSLLGEQTEVIWNRDVALVERVSEPGEIGRRPRRPRSLGPVVESDGVDRVEHVPVAYSTQPERAFRRDLGNRSSPG